MKELEKKQKEQGMMAQWHLPFPDFNSSGWQEKEEKEEEEEAAQASRFLFTGFLQYTGILVSLCEQQFIDCFESLEWIASLGKARSFMENPPLHPSDDSHAVPRIGVFCWCFLYHRST